MTNIPDTTADAVVGATEAVVLGRGTTDAALVAAFLDLPPANASEALQLAVDLGLIKPKGSSFEEASPLARLLTTPVLAQRAAILRVAVEAYEPYRVFRGRLHDGGGNATTAAQQTAALLSITQHREIVKQTLVSLGTYCHSILAKGGGQFEVRFTFEPSITEQLRSVVAELAEAELRVRDWLSEEARDYSDAKDVLAPLAEAYLKVAQADSRGAVVVAGNAVESFLVKLAGDLGVSVSSAHGLGAKVAALETAKALPKKLITVGRYLGNVRNAADHGIDTETGKAWMIRDSTGEDFLRVSISFMESALAIKNGRDPTI